MSWNGFLLFQPPQEGETIYSLFCRFAERTGIPATRILERFLGSGSRSISTALPTYVKPIAEKLPPGYPDGEKLVSEHTTLPYFLYFRPPENRAYWIRRFTEHESSYYLLSGIGLAAFPCPPQPVHPRFCPECLTEDLRERGFSFFRREHQLPGAVVCRTHRVPLCSGCTKCGPYPLKRRMFRMPGGCGCEDGIKPAPAYASVPAGMETLIWLAEESATIVRSAGTECPDPTGTLRRAAVEKGFGSPRGVDHESLAQGIESRFGEDVLEFLGTPARRGGRFSPWVRSLTVRRRAHHGRQTIHLLLAIGTLFETVEDFERAGRAAATEPAVPPRPVRRERPEWARNLPERIERSDGNLSGLAGRLGITHRKLIYEIRRQGLRFPLSTVLIAKLGKRTISRIRRDLRRGLSRKDTCLRNGCSAWAVLRIQLDDPSLGNPGKESIIEKHRRKFLRYAAAHPDAGRRQMHFDPGLRYTLQYLRKHDKEWLLSHLPGSRRSGAPKGPRKTRIDWPNLDKENAVNLEMLINEELAKEDEPVWLTRSRMLSWIGLVMQHHRYPNRLPLIEEVVSRRAETKEAYDIRRLKWAVKQIAEQDETLSLTSIRRVINIKNETIHKHSDALIDFARQYGVQINDQSIFNNPDLSD